MKRLVLTLALAGLFALPATSTHADTTTTVGVVDGTILNADGTAYAGTPLEIRFTPVDPKLWDSNFGFYTGVATANGIQPTVSDPASTNNGLFTTATFPYPANGYSFLKPIQYYVYVDYPNVGGVDMSIYRDVLPAPQVVDLRGGASAHLTFQLLPSYKRIHGVVTDDSGMPLSSLNTSNPYHVCFSRQGATGYASNNGLAVGYFPNDGYCVMTDANGRYSFSVSSHGDVISVAPQTGDLHFLQGMPHSTITFSNDSALDDREVNFTLQRAGTTTITGRILNRDGKPFDQKIYALQANASTVTYGTELDANNFPVITSMNWSRAVVQSDGTFTFKLVPGTWQVSFEARQTTGRVVHYVDFPTQSVTLVLDQNYDLGDITPNRAYTYDPDNTFAPEIITYQDNQRVRVQVSPALAGQYNILFDKQNYNNLASHFQTTWEKDTIVISSPIVATSSTGQYAALSVKTVTAYAATIGATQAYVISKPITPKNVKIKAVALTGEQTITGDGTISYAVSPDGVTWLTVVPGKTTIVPTTWNTTTGLRWRATLQRGTSTSQVRLKGITLKYTYVTTNSKLKISSVKVVRKGATINLTISGKSLSNSTMVYMGSRHVSKSYSAKTKTIKVALKVKDLKYGKYQVTVVNPDLQAASTKAFNIFVSGIQK